MTTLQDTQLFLDIHGGRARIPNLGLLLADWPHEVSNHRNAIAPVVERVIADHDLPPAVGARLRGAKFCSKIASEYPFASFTRLKDITYLECWLLMIDYLHFDMIRWPGMDNEAAFDAAYKEMDDFVSKNLKLDGDTAHMSEQLTTSFAAVNSFRHVGEVLCKNYTLKQRELFFDEYRRTMDGYRTDQQIRVFGRFPRGDDLRIFREESSGVWLCVALIEFSMELAIPASFMKSKEMQQLWTLTNMLCCLCNEIVSGLQYLGEDHIRNVVSWAAIASSAQEWLGRTFCSIEEAKDRFEELARLMLEKVLTLDETSCNDDTGEEYCYESTRDVAPQLLRFIQGCQCMVTGSLYQRLVTAASPYECVHAISDIQQLDISTLGSVGVTKGLDS